MLLLIILITVVPFLVAAPGALVALIDAPEFFGRPSRPRPVAVVRRWQVA